jgi:hypothetical protein
MAGLIDLSQMKLDPSKTFQAPQQFQAGLDPASASASAKPMGIGDMLKQWAPQMSQAGGMMGGQPTDFSDTEGLNNQLMQHMQALNAARMGRY